MENSLNISRLARVRVALSGLIAAAIVASLAFPVMLWLIAAFVVLLLIADWPILAWMVQKRGLCFTLTVLPWHWFSHFYSGCGFTTAVLLHTFMRIFDKKKLAKSVSESAVQGSV